MALTLAETKELIDELEASGDMTHAEHESYYEKLTDMEWRSERATRDGPVFAGEHTYIIAVEHPSSFDGATKSERKVVPPTIYQPKERYQEDTKPAVEELSLKPLASGTMEEYRWANGDPYDGFSARIGVPPTLGPALNEYVRGLGLWDLMIDTIYNNPMEPDSTRFYNLTSPFGDGVGRNFTWSAKRPGNFYGSDVSEGVDSVCYFFCPFWAHSRNLCSARILQQMQCSPTCTGLISRTRQPTKILSGRWPREASMRY